MKILKFAKRQSKKDKIKLKVFMFNLLFKEKLYRFRKNIKKFWIVEDI